MWEVILAQMDYLASYKDEYIYHINAMDAFCKYAYSLLIRSNKERGRRFGFHIRMSQLCNKTAALADGKGKRVR